MNRCCTLSGSACCPKKWLVPCTIYAACVLSGNEAALRGNCQLRGIRFLQSSSQLTHQDLNVRLSPEHKDTLPHRQLRSTPVSDSKYQMHDIRCKSRRAAGNILDKGLQTTTLNRETLRIDVTSCLTPDGDQRHALTDIARAQLAAAGCAFTSMLYHTILSCIMLYYVTLCYTMLYYAIPCYTILYYTILYYTILYYTILYYTILYYTILYYTILYYTLLFYTILYYSLLYSTLLYYTILYYTDTLMNRPGILTIKSNTCSYQASS